MTLQTELTIIVILTAMATVTLWREAARKAPRPKKKFITALLHSEPITPRHEPPHTVSGETDFSWLVTDRARLFFGDFVDFAAVVNWWLADVGSPWRLQELPNTVLELGFYDMHHFGRRYAVYHNQVHLGTLEVSPGIPYSAKEPNVFAAIELNWVRLLSFDAIQSFLTDIALHVSDPDQNSSEYLRTRHCIDSALMQVLWQTVAVSEFGMDGEDWGQLELRLNGIATWYLVRRDALRKREAAA
jgi:hypothetical protein